MTVGKTSAPTGAPGGDRVAVRLMGERISSMIQLPALRWQGWAGPHASRSRVVHSVILGDDSINTDHISYTYTVYGSG